MSTNGYESENPVILYREVKTHHYEIQRMWKVIEYLLSIPGGNYDLTYLENRIRTLENKLNFISYNSTTGKSTIDASRVYVSYTDSNNTQHNETLQTIIQQIGSGGSSGSNLEYFEVSESKTNNNITLTIKPKSSSHTPNISIPSGTVTIGNDTNGSVQFSQNGNIAVKENNKTVNLNVGDLIKVKHIGLPSRKNNPTSS